MPTFSSLMGMRRTLPSPGDLVDKHVRSVLAGSRPDRRKQPGVSQQVRMTNGNAAVAADATADRPAVPMRAPVSGRGPRLRRSRRPRPDGGSPPVVLRLAGRIALRAVARLPLASSCVRGDRGEQLPHSLQVLRRIRQVRRQAFWVAVDYVADPRLEESKLADRFVQRRRVQVTLPVKDPLLVSRGLRGRPPQ